MKSRQDTDMTIDPLPNPWLSVMERGRQAAEVSGILYSMLKARS